jgi:thiol:disulfide interchange protein
MVTKKIIAPLFIVILLAGISGVFAAQKATNRQVESTMHADETHSVHKSGEANPVATTANYATYSESAAQNSTYEHTVLFFTASWCPECRAFDKALSSNQIPDNTQILKVDYDKATDLKKKYGVTLQSTFVSVNPEGKLLNKWVGYGKDKSADAVLKNLKL